MKRLFITALFLHFCFLANALSIEFTLDIPEVKVGEHFRRFGREAELNILKKSLEFRNE